MHRWSDNIRGAAWMSGSMAGFVLNDALVKVVSSDLGLFQVLFLRGLFTTGLLAFLAWRSKALFVFVPRTDRSKLILRTIGETGGTLCYLTALFNMPLANATAILQALPLAVTVGAALFFGEAVGWRRYIAVLIGFSGVMIIVRPGAEGFNVYAVWAIAAIFFIVLRDLVTHRLSTQVPSRFVALVGAFAITLVGGVLSPVTTWGPVGGIQLLYLASAAVFLVFGYLFGVMTMRVGEISFIAPFRYTVLIWAIFLGIVIFGDIPDFWTLTGSTVVIVTGFYTFHRERRQRRAEVQSLLNSE